MGPNLDDFCLVEFTSFCTICVHVHLFWASSALCLGRMSSVGFIGIHICVGHLQRDSIQFGKYIAFGTFFKCLKYSPQAFMSCTKIYTR